MTRGRARGRRLSLQRGEHRRRAERRTLGLAVLALASTGSVAVVELARVWKRGSAPLPAETEDVFAAAEEAARQTVEVAVTGFREGSAREGALLNMLLSFTVSFGLVRGITHLVRRRGRVGPFGDIKFGRRHIHHFVPGIVIAFLAGGVSIVTRDEALDTLLAVPFGLGMALTLDESALLIELDDVYWSERGVLSVEITLAALGMLSTLALALRLLHRGEARVLPASSV
jgi:hypothetical protein